ncbi:MAG: FCD domain-containing protein [Chloroflexi bacterium]|nr:FCD domain-containing protein [Chloroflexota bacterium]MDE2635079.1 FCD domain-containing protein [Chloroflexota bacterium]
MDINLGSDFLNYIIRQGYQPGDRLPSIQELTADTRLDMSANKVREQLEVARQMGWVEVRSKRGTRIKDYAFTPAVRLSALYAMACGERFEDFASLRNHVESAYWREACALLTEADLNVMQGCIDSANQKLDSPPIHIPNPEHRLFHLTVFKNLDNTFVLGILEAYWDLYEEVGVNRYMDYSYLRQVWDYHSRILELIRAGRFEEAQQAFVEHTRLLRHEPNNASWELERG